MNLDDIQLIINISRLLISKVKIFFSFKRTAQIWKLKDQSSLRIRIHIEILQVSWTFIHCKNLTDERVRFGLVKLFCLKEPNNKTTILCFLCKLHINVRYWFSQIAFYWIKMFSKVSIAFRSTLIKI